MKRRGHHRRISKRTKIVGVRVSLEDLETLRAAAARVWGNAPVTTSTLVLTLALERAREILKPGKKK